MSNDFGPPAKGKRLRWSDIPEPLRIRVESWVGARILASQDQEHGFSPGVAALLTAANGTEVFVKAVGPAPNPTAPMLHQQEAVVASSLPAGVPVPRLLESYSDPTSGWVVLMFEAIHGRHPHLPWNSRELERVLAAIEDLSAALTPAPLAVKSAGDHFTAHIHGWQRLQTQANSSPDHLDDWSRRHLDHLAELEQAAPAAVCGNTLLHFDLRADNILLTERLVYFVDWPHACTGAPWVDLIGMAPSIAMQGGPEPEELMQRTLAYQMAPPEAITAAVVALAGYFTYHALQPPPSGLPTLRAFQAAQGEVARRWVARRIGGN